MATAVKTLKLTKAHARKVLEIVDCGLTEGTGIPERGKLCVEAAVCLALGLPHGDDPPCVGKAVREFKIRLNDSCWSSNKARAKGLRRLAIAQLGSDTLNQTEFVTKLQEAVIRRIVPMALRNAAKCHPDQKRKDTLESAAVQCADEGTESAAWSAARSAESAWSAAWSAARSAESAWSAARSAWSAARSAELSESARDESLSIAAEICVGVLIEMKSPGCKWLDLTEAA